MKNLSMFLLALVLLGCNGEVQRACSPAGVHPQIRPYELQLPVTASASTRARVWEVASSDTGLIFVSGVDGGFVEPVDGIYERLASQLARYNVASVFVRYRHPGVLEPAVADALSAARWLRGKGVRKMALVGWSFGGAVISHGAVRIPEVRTVVGFAAQSRDTEAVGLFRGQSLLLFHDYDDDNVPYSAVRQIMEELPPGTRAIHHPISGSDHYLSGKQEEIDPVVFDWLMQELEIKPCTG